MAKNLKITKARENNLKEVSLEIPHDKMVVITGISGSGKSSLAFDTVYAEGQRRYIETFSPYTRQFLDRVKHPNVDTIENVRPAIAIQQRTRILSSRSTVGSMTNINDYLKLLWSNLAQPYCPSCNKPIKAWKANELSAHIIAQHSSTGFPQLLIAAPTNFQNKPFIGEVERLKSLGFSRFYDFKASTLKSLEDVRDDNLSPTKLLFIVLDRVKSGTESNSVAIIKRIRESIEQCFSLSYGNCAVINTENNKIDSYSNIAYCEKCAVKIARPRPALFSFNHPLGACSACNGFGKVLEVDPDKVIPNPMLSIKAGAIQCWQGKAGRNEQRRIVKFCESRNIPLNKPWIELAQEQRELIFNHKSREFRGIRHWFKLLESKTYKMHVRVFLAKYRAQIDCATCNGSRLKQDALSYKIDNKTIANSFVMPISDLLSWIRSVYGDKSRNSKLPRQLRDIFTATTSRLEFLYNLGLSYLTLDRQSRTLSGGETQRVNLATALGSELISTHFVLDEPSVGLHARDSSRLIDAVKGLQARGNSLLVVEHDPDFIKSADHIIEVGPLAGKQGGEIVYNGTISDWDRSSIIPVSTEHSANKINNASLQIKSASARNLKGFDLRIPLNAFVCLTGVSGSGKSTLAHEVIKKAYDRFKIGLKNEDPTNLVLGFEKINQLLVVDQSPLAKSPRANIATYSGIWDTVRDLLAASDDAQTRALSKSAFSFNVVGGRCPHCEGAGFIREDMQFLSDVFIQCEVCLGRRFQESVLEVRYKWKNAHDLLQMTVDECTTFFNDYEKVAGVASTLSLLGLGHLTLGHPLSELSGGEAQRVKLVPFIEQSNSEQSLLVFDEPTTGLHTRDVERLIKLFITLRNRGHSILCIEHNLLLINAADWIIDLGPEGGEQGGSVLFEGTPTDLINTKSNSYTALHLKKLLSPTRDTNQKTTKSTQDSTEFLTIQGAREHNLKDIDVQVPLNKIVTFTGVSGSGKSSIAKDIIYAEGQRRYLDCLSPYARQFIQELKRPEIDSIKNVKPSICVYQHTFQPSRFSTVGTMSESYNYLRLLYSKLGTQYCPDHPMSRISPMSPDEIAEAIKKMADKSIRILAPVIKQKKGNHRAVLERAVASEILQVRIDGVFLASSTVSMGGGLEKNKVHTIEYVIAKFNPANAPKDLIQECILQGLSLGGGTIVVHSDKSETIFSTERTCPICKRGFFKPDPEDLSFHSKRGKCSNCEGAGRLEGGEICSECGGTRINPIGRNIKIAEMSIHDAVLLTAPALSSFLKSLVFDEREKAISDPILRELHARLETLESMGIDYIPLDRDCMTLSGGELQRLRLATAMGSPLTGAMYIFDEPSAGLHPADNRKVLAELKNLRDRGNSIIVIEHEADSIKASDHIIEVGPGGGKDGGQIIFTGTPLKLLSSNDTPTAKAFNLEHPVTTSHEISVDKIKIKNGTANNIRELNCEIPLRSIVTVCGVSGAGKSSLVHHILSKTLQEGKNKGLSWSMGGIIIESSTPIERVLQVDQKPIGINSRSTPASYLGIFDEMRKVFANALEAKARGWSAGFFSYNTGAGKCPDCKGLGVIKLEMNFLPDAAVLCETCQGQRFSEEANTVLFQGMTISDALNFTFEEAKSRFANHRKILQPIRQACELGLGYLKLGQSSTTLSGGESQRIKIVSELSASRHGHTLYILDEPTTGLHKSDVAKLMKVLRELISAGHSVLLIEHDTDVILNSDFILELGPGPGAKGGHIIYSGAPSALLKYKGWTPWKTELSRIASLQNDHSNTA